MRFNSRSSESAEFERGCQSGRKQERELIVQQFNEASSNVTAALFVIELITQSNKAESASKASKAAD
jgi:hypothetical protein